RLRLGEPVHGGRQRLGEGGRATRGTVGHLHGQRAARVGGDDGGDLGVVGELVVVLRAGAPRAQPGTVDRVHDVHHPTLPTGGSRRGTRTGATRAAGRGLRAGHPPGRRTGQPSDRSTGRGAGRRRRRVSRSGAAGPG